MKTIKNKYSKPDALIESILCEDIITTSNENSIDGSDDATKDSPSLQQNKSISTF